MTQKEENFLSMARAVVAGLDRHRDLWSGTERFQKAHDQLITLLAAAEEVGVNRNLQTKGITMDKVNSEDKAVALAIRLADRAQVYALDTDNMELWKQLELSDSGLKQVADGETLTRLQSLIRTLEELGAVLEPYVVRGEELGQLRDAVAAYEADIARPREATSLRKGYRSSLPGILREMRTNFQVLDRLINLWEDTTMEREYWNTRMIIDLGSRKQPPAAAPGQA